MNAQVKKVSPHQGLDSHTLVFSGPGIYGKRSCVFLAHHPECQ